MVSNTPVEESKIFCSERLLSLYRMPGIIQLTTAITTQWGVMPEAQVTKLLSTLNCYLIIHRIFLSDSVPFFIQSRFEQICTFRMYLIH